MDIKNLFDIAKIFIPLFVVIDPIGSMVLFVSMTSSYSELEKREATKDAFVYGLIIMILFTLGGSILLELMGISISAIQIAGGIILLIMGIEMVREGDRPKSTGKTYKNPDLEIFVPNVKRMTTIMKIVIRDARTSIIAYKPD